MAENLKNLNQERKEAACRERERARASDLDTTDDEKTSQHLDERIGTKNSSATN